MKEVLSSHYRTKKLLEASQAIAHVGGWELDLITKDLFWTEETYRIHDTTPKEYNPTLEAEINCYLPDSREILLEALKVASEDGEGFDLELELKTTKGRNIHVRTTCEVTILEGKPVILAGALQDVTNLITAQKQLTNALEKSEKSEQNLHNIINSIGDPLFVKDSQSRIVIVNDAFCKIFEISSNEVIGRTLSERVPPVEEENFLKIDRQVIATGQESIVEETLTVRDSQTRIISTRKTRYIDNEGNKFLIGTIRDITSKKREEEKLRVSNQLLEASQSIALVGGWELDLITKDLFWTEETYRIHDTTPEEYNPTLDAGVDRYLPESREILLDALRLATEDGKEYDLELELKTTKSRNIHVRTNCEVTTHEGKPVKLTGAIQDITGRKNYEQKIKESEVALSATLNALTSSICVIDETGKIIQVNKTWKEFGEAGGHNRPPECYADYNYFDVCKADFENEDAKAVYYGLQGLLKGDIDSFEHEYPCHAPDQNQWFMLRANLMETTAKQIVISHIDITKRKNLEIKEKELYQQTQLAIKTAKLGFWTLDLISGNLNWNDELLQIYGLTRDKWKSDMDGWRQQIHPEDADYANGQLAQIFEGKPVYEVEFRIFRPDGEIRYINASGAPVYNEHNELVQAIGINHDITDQKRNEVALIREKELTQESEERYRLLHENAGLGIGYFSVEGIILSFNSIALKDLNREQEEFVGKSIFDVFPKNVAGRYFNRIQEVLKTGVIKTFEDFVELPNEDKWFLSTYCTITDSNQKTLGVQVISQNITQLKQAELKIKESEGKFSKAFENSPNPTSILNIKTGESLAINRAFCQTFGYSNTELLGGNIHMNNLMLDQAEVKASFENVVKNESLHQHPAKMLHKSGAVLDMLYTSTKLYPDNEDIHLVSFRDVTEVKKYEKRLLESDRVFSLSIDMFCIAGFDGYFKNLNPAWERTLGWSTEELLTKPWIEFIHHDDKNNTEDIKTVIVGGKEVLEFENRYLCKDGSVKWLSWKSQPFPDEHIMVGAARDITLQKQHEQKLKQSEAHLQKAQQIAKLGSWYLDIKTNAVTWTEELYKMFGLDSAMPVPTWNEQQKDYTGKSWELLSSAVDKTSKDGVPYELELNIIRKDKSTGWITSRGEAIKNDSGEIYALSGIAQDITSRKHAERELRKLSTAIEQSPESIVITDTKGVIEYANPRFSEVSGYALDEVIGQNPKVLQSGHHDTSFYKNMWGTLSSGKIWKGEFLNKNKNDELYWERASISPLKNPEGVITNYVAIKENITKEKKMLKELNEAKERAEAANQLKDVFLANTSHEIRTPLNAIIGFSRLLSDDLSENDKEIYLDQIKSNSEQLLSLVNDLLNLTKLEGGNVELINKPVVLNKLVHSIFAQHLQYIETDHKELELKLTVPKSDQDLIQVDETKLKEVLHNLIDNAVKFTKKGTIEIGYTLTSNEIEFFVKDDGIGIPLNQQDAIFTRFTQVTGTSDKYGGTGLGLSICRGLVDVMGGKIWVESEINVGSTFLFTLPRVSAELSKASPIEKISVSRSGKPINKVLVADDSASIRLFYKTIMKKHKVDTLIAKNGEEAVQLYQQNIDKIDLVLMDIRMPGMDGIEAMKRIKEINPNIKVVAQTAFAMDSELERFRKEGFDDCLTKPIPENELMKLLNGEN